MQACVPAFPVTYKNPKILFAAVYPAIAIDPKEFTDDCKNEILEIYEYISQNLASTEAAKKLMKKIKTSIMY